MFKIGDEIVIHNNDRDFPIAKMSKVCAIRTYGDGSIGVWVENSALCFNPDGSICSALQKSHPNFYIRPKSEVLV